VARRYNFRYQPERERFYDDLNDAYDEFRERYEEFGFDRKSEFSSELRFVFDVGDFTSTDRKKHHEEKEKTGHGKFRGVRSFLSLSRVKRFLNSTREGGSGIQWGKKNFEEYNMTARIVFYKMRGSRVVGEKVLRKFEIVSTPK
jgi:hypothetical protein